MSLTPNYTRADPDYQRLQRQQAKWMASGRVPKKLRPFVEAVHAAYKSGESLRLRVSELPPSDEQVVWGPSARLAMRRSASARAPRRARSRSAARRATNGSATSTTATGADPPVPEPPRRQTGGAAAVAPVLVTDAPVMAGVLAAAVGLTPRQLRDLVAERGIRHAKPGRNIYVRIKDLLSALGLSGASAVSTSTAAELSEDEIVALAAGEEGST